MIENWREILYPLGFLSSVAFTLRFVLQWLASEKCGESIVMPAFWKISLAGNLLLFAHSFIQIQFHVCVIQVCNAVISWRNLNLMQSRNAQWKLLSVVFLLGGTIVITTSAFFLQVYHFPDSSQEWFRTPITPWSSGETRAISPLLHFVGTVGIVLFNSRFWVQWWGAEKHHESYLGVSFWWLSLAGALLSIAYFWVMGDTVNLVGLLFGLIPYARNLMLIYRTPTECR